MSQVIGKKLRLMNVPTAIEQETVQQLVITPEGKVRKTANQGNSEDYVYMFRLAGGFFEHIHTVCLTASDVTFLVLNANQQGQNTLTKRSNVINEHFHDVTFFYDIIQNKFFPLNITDGGDIVHNCVLIANEPSYFETYLSITQGLFNSLIINARGNIDYVYNRVSEGIWNFGMNDLEDYTNMFLIGGAQGIKLIKTGDREFTIETRNDQGVLSDNILDNFGLIIRVY